MEKIIKTLLVVLLAISVGLVFWAVFTTPENPTVENATAVGVYLYWGYALMAAAVVAALFGAAMDMFKAPSGVKRTIFSFVAIVGLIVGAYVIANHLYDIDCAEDEDKYLEPTAPGDNAIGLTRYPFINFYKCNNITLAGRGVIDMTRLDRRERRGVVFTDCNDVTVSDVKIINSPEWSFISYCCTNVAIDNVDIIGNRGNCDGFAICNSHNVTVDNCFARVADDTFEVKALGGMMDSRNITFSDCIAWGGYARCFGITGEVNKQISDVTFRDCAVIYRDGVWNNDRIGSLVVVAEQTEGGIDNILFENIEIFRDEGRAILVKIYDEEAENFEMKNIVFRNISYTSYLPSKIAGNDSDTNTVQAELENITAYGKKVTLPSLLFNIGRYSDVTIK